MKLAVAGLTHLGVCLSIAAHEAGVDVVAVDVEASRVAAVRRAEFDSAEPGVVDFLLRNSDRYVISDDLAIVASADLVMIAIDTVLDADGENDEREVVTVLEAVARYVRADVPLVIVSQVRPGFTRAHAHVHPSLYYLMETLIFGRGLERAMNPEQYVVGRPDDEKTLPAALREYLALPGCPVHVMSYESAELTKLSVNVVLAASITAANSLADLSSRLGADWREIEPALKGDSRIGSHGYVSAGLGIGGGNLTRDLHGVKSLADRVGADSTLAAAMLHHSGYMRDWIVRAIVELRRDVEIERMAVLGLAYKPGTQSTRGGSGMDLVATFERVLEIVVHDPAVTMSDRPGTGRALQVDEATTAMADAQVIAIATPWPEYKGVIRGLLATDPEVIIVDPYRLIESGWVRSSRARVIQLGVAHD